MSVRMDREIEELGAEFKTLTRGRGGKLRGIPLELKVRAVELCERSGLHRDGFRRRLGLPGSTFFQWARLASKDKLGRSGKALKRNPGFKELKVTANGVGDKSTPRLSESPSKGIVIEEYPVDQPWLWREARIKDLDNNQIIIYVAGDNRLNPPWRIDRPQ